MQGIGQTISPAEAPAHQATSARRDWVGIVANAHSGIGRGRARVERLIRELGALGLPAQVAWTLAERSQLVAEAGRDPRSRCLVAVGGDGTVADLVNERPEVPITVLPAGTENLFAQHFGMKRRPSAVAATVAAGRVEPLDLGFAAGRRFALMLGVGFDADVVSRHHRSRIGSSGAMRPTHRGAYFDSVLRASCSYRFPNLTVSVADPGREETLIGTSAFVFNLPRYALGLPFAPRARGDDGLLDLVVFRDPGPWRALHYLWLVLRRAHLDRQGVYHRRVANVEVASAEPVPIQLDGDPAGILEPTGGDGSTWSVRVLPRAIRVVVPASYARPSAAG
jgi:diacylglycerol kinase family enzyme